MPKKKIKAETEDKENSEEKEKERALSQKELIYSLAHPGEVGYQILVSLNQTNQLLERIAKAEEERNQIAKEEYSEEEEDEEEDEEDED